MTRLSNGTKLKTLTIHRRRVAPTCSTGQTGSGRGGVTSPIVPTLSDESGPGSHPMTLGKSRCCSSRLYLAVVTPIVTGSIGWKAVLRLDTSECRVAPAVHGITMEPRDSIPCGHLEFYASSPLNSLVLV